MTREQLEKLKDYIEAAIVYAMVSPKPSDGELSAENHLGKAGEELEELFFGYANKCSDCDGTGTLQYLDKHGDFWGDEEECPTCDGKGTVSVAHLRKEYPR